MTTKRKQSLGNKDITVIVLVHYETDKTIKCLESLYNTDYPFKLLVVCDGADDYLKKYLKDNVVGRLVINKKHLGVVKTWAVAEKLIDTDFFFFAHSDMVFEKDWLSELVKKYDSLENPGYILPINLKPPGFLIFNFLIETKLYKSIPIDKKYKLHYLDFDWYQQFKIEYPNLCGILCEEAKIYHDTQTTMIMVSDIDGWGDDAKEDAKYYYSKYNDDPHPIYGEPVYKEEYLKTHKCKWREVNAVHPKNYYILPSGSYAIHYYQCPICNKKIENEEFKRQKDTLLLEGEINI